MSKTVVCINDQKLPPGADLAEGREYTVLESFINSFDQRVYILEGVENNGRTKFGLPWIGYSSERFADLDGIYQEEKEVNYALN